MPKSSANRNESSLTLSDGIITSISPAPANTDAASHEQQLRIFEGITSTTPDFVYAFDLQGRFIFANRRLLEVWGIKLSEAVGKTCRELGYEQWHHDMHMREIAQVIATKQSIKGEVPFKAALTGIFGVYEYIFTPVIGHDGKVELIAGTTRDVTDRKLTEQALSEREQRYRELFNSMTEGFCIIEKLHMPPGTPIDYRFVEANPSVATQSGISGVLGKTIREIVPAEADYWIEMYDRVAVSGESIRVERDLATQARRLELYAYRVRTGDKPQVGVIFRDITERKKAETALAQAQLELKQHAESLEQLVADRTAKLRETIVELETLSYSISHDMRAPLRAMQGFSQALLEDYRTKLDDEGVSYLERISSASERLDSLIQDILLYSKVAREKLVLSPVPLEPLIHEILDTYHPDQISKVSILPPFPSVMGHPAFLSQIISNLVTNALKFVRKGQSPEVIIRSEPDGEFVKVWVEDKGVGIEPQHLDRIFQVFGRVYSESEYPGTGIGLAIVKRAVQRMGGEAGVESIAGQGSRFWITIKKAPPPAVISASS